MRASGSSIQCPSVGRAVEITACASEATAESRRTRFARRGANAAVRSGISEIAKLPLAVGELEFEGFSATLKWLAPSSGACRRCGNHPARPKSPPLQAPSVMP